MAFIDEVKTLLSQSSGYMIKDAKGKLHPVQAGTKGEVVEVSSKDDLYNLVWGKQRVGASDIQELAETVAKIKEFVLANASYQTKKKIEAELK